jgi:hypothetical protein
MALQYAVCDGMDIYLGERRANDYFAVMYVARRLVVGSNLVCS